MPQPTADAQVLRGQLSHAKPCAHPRLTRSLSNHEMRVRRKEE